MPACGQVLASLAIVSVVGACVIAATAVRVLEPLAPNGLAADAPAAVKSGTCYAVSAVASVMQCQLSASAQNCPPCTHTPCDSVANDVVGALQGKFSELVVACVSGHEKLYEMILRMNATSAETLNALNLAKDEALAEKQRSGDARQAYALSVPLNVILVAAFVQIRYGSVYDTLGAVIIVALFHLLSFVAPWLQIAASLAAFAVAAGIVAFREYTKKPETIREQMTEAAKPIMAEMRKAVGVMLGADRMVHHSPAQTAEPKPVVTPEETTEMSAGDESIPAQHVASYIYAPGGMSSADLVRHVPRSSLYGY